MKSANIIPCQKHLFSIPENIHYLNGAYQGPYPKSVEAIGIECLKRKSKPFVIGAADFFDPNTALKKVFAKLIHVSDYERIAVIPSASYGMANVVNNVAIEAGQDIVVLDEQFPSNYYPWSRMAKEKGANIKVVAAPPIAEGRGALWNQRILEAIDNNTRVVAVPNIHWADGTLYDLEAISAKAKSVGAYFILDASQSVGALPLDVGAIGADAIVCVGYKWLLGSHGLGCAYYGPKFDHGKPLEDNWINKKESDNFAKLVNYQDEYREKANRYNVGQTSNFITTPMLTASIEHILSTGIENIQNYCAAITADAIDRLCNLGCFVEADAYRAKHLFGIYLGDGMDMETLKKELIAANVYVSYRGNAVRVSPNVYNDVRDLERLVAVFEGVRK